MLREFVLSSSTNKVLLREYEPNKFRVYNREGEYWERKEPVYKETEIEGIKYVSNRITGYNHVKTVWDDKFYEDDSSFDCFFYPPETFLHIVDSGFHFEFPRDFNWSFYVDGYSTNKWARLLIWVLENLLPDWFEDVRTVPGYDFYVRIYKDSSVDMTLPSSDYYSYSIRASIKIYKLLGLNLPKISALQNWWYKDIHVKGNKIGKFNFGKHCGNYVKAGYLNKLRTLLAFIQLKQFDFGDANNN